MEERKYIGISIKHSEYESKRFKGCMCLWGRKRTEVNSERCFSGYTLDPNKCEIYTLQEFRDAYGNGFIKCDEPVKMTPDICKRYKKYDTVLVSKDEYMSYFNLLGLSKTAY